MHAPSKDVQACVCNFKDDLKKLNSAYDADVTKHPGWNGPNTVVIYVEAPNGKSVVINFQSVKRQLDACARH